MSAELLVYAIIAAGLVFWLRSILGTRNEEDQNQPAPRLELDEQGKVVNLDAPEAKVADKSGLVNELFETPKGNMSIGGETAKDALLTIANTDRSFDVYVFMQAAQDAFAYIVESFADGDRETLKELLSPDVYNAFDGAITKREEAGEKMITEITAISKSEIIEARIENRRAFITLRIWAQETSVTRDAEGNVIAGHPDAVTEMRDVWTFARDLKSKDPSWLVVETREDGEGDNESIPNTH